MLLPLFPLSENLEVPSKPLTTLLLTHQDTLAGWIFPKSHGYVEEDDSIAYHEYGDILCSRSVNLILQRPLQSTRQFDYETVNTDILIITAYGQQSLTSAM